MSNVISIRVSIISSFGPVGAEGKISEDGNKIVIDARDKARVTLTRKWRVSKAVGKSLCL
jgi:hypothetical protein